MGPGSLALPWVTIFLETKKEDNMAGSQGGMPTNMSTPRGRVQHQGWGAHLNIALVTYLILQHTVKTNHLNVKITETAQGAGPQRGGLTT